MRILRIPCCIAAVLWLTSCSTPPANRPNQVHAAIQDEMKRAVDTSATKSKAANGDAVTNALLPPLQLDASPATQPEPRFDLAVRNAPASQVFMGIVSGTPYSMLVSPEVTGTVTLNLKNVTVRETLDAIRDLYGYEYRVQGNRIWIQPNTMQTRVFKVNYLAGRRQGTTDTRLLSNTVVSSNNNSNGYNGGNSNTTNVAPALPGENGTATSSSGGARVATTIDADFWKDMRTALNTIVGSADGRSVVLNADSGVIVVRALPAELRNVESYLKATQLTIERQVMLEAKIIEVGLSDEYQAGINWAAFRGSGSTRSAFGVLGKNSLLQPSGGTAGTPSGSLSNGDGTTALPGLGGLLSTTPLGNGLVGLAFQTNSFAALLNFLESQGNVQVLSSPRIATINNQKAILKVGTDDFFVTNVSTTTIGGTGTTTSTPSVTLQPFFSGISLDVTPQIDDGENVILHVHPVISSVTEKTKTINLGTAAGTLVLPLASSSVNESDSVVRVEDGYIVAIGGLMKQRQTKDKSQLPGLGDAPVVGNLFGQRSTSYSKSELVILIKPTIIRGESSWEPDLLETRRRLGEYAQ